MKAHLNLMPWEFRRQLLIRARLLGWSVVWATALLLVVAVWCIKSQQLVSLRHRLSQLEQKSSPLRQIKDDNGQLRKKIAELNGRQSLLGELACAEHPLQLIGIVGRSARQGGGQVQVRSLLLTELRQAAVQESTKDDKSPTEPAKTAPEVLHKTRLTLEGVAVDDLALAQFVAALRDTGVFESVELKSSVATVLAKWKARQYHVECTF